MKTKIRLVEKIEYEKKPSLINILIVLFIIGFTFWIPIKIGFTDFGIYLIGFMMGLGFVVGIENIRKSKRIFVEDEK